MTREEFIANKQKLLYEHDSKLIDIIREPIEDSINNSKDYSVEICWPKDTSYLDRAIEIESKIYPFLEFKYDRGRTGPCLYNISYRLKEEQTSN